MIDIKKTIVLGASLNPDRYSHRAVLRLRANGHEVVAIGRTVGNIGDVEIRLDWPKGMLNIHTLTMYLSAENQKGYYNDILSTKIERLIFNPGAENPDLYMKLRANGVEVKNQCTLVQLSLGNF